MIKKAFLNNVYLQRIHDEYILDMYTKKVCKQQNIFVKPIKQYTVLQYVFINKPPGGVTGTSGSAAREREWIYTWTRCSIVFYS